VRSLVALLCIGCAAQTAESPPPREIEAPAESTSQPPTAAAPAARPATPAGTISRNELLGLLDKSPGAFLQHVEVSPRFSGGRFAGWRIGALFPGDDRFAHCEVQAGDVVLRVNGRSVEKPEQLMEVWQLLRSAPALEIDLERNGEPRSLRWPIQ
jgi:type II secretory pathway component PulC